MPSVRKHFSFPRAIFFPSKEKELSCLGKRIFLRWKRCFPSKERIPPFEGIHPPPYSLLSLLHWEVGGDSGGRVMEALVLLLGSWLGDEDEAIRWDTSLEPLLELGLLGGRERLA